MAESPQLSTEANKHGVDPKKLLVDAAASHRLLGIGECHVGEPGIRPLIADIMPDLKRQGINDVFLEASPKAQQAFDELKSTGHITDRMPLPLFLRNDSGIKLLEAADKAGMTLHPIDIDHGQRDAEMARKLQTFFDNNLDAKALFIGGGGHMRRDTYTVGKTVSEPAVGILRRNGIDAFTALEARDICMDEMLTEAAKVKRLTALPTHLSDATASIRIASDRADQFDAIVAFPGGKNATVDMAHTHATSANIQVHLLGTYLTPKEYPLIGRLNLNETGANDTTVSVLAQLRNLKEIDVRKTSISPEGIATLQRALPHARILHD